MTPSRTADDGADDPVTAEYDVYITPALREKLYLVQFPTRDRESPYNEAHHNKPVEMRLKPTTGFVEVDVPINPQSNYDSRKAHAWAKELKRAKKDGAHGFGMASGLRNVVPPRALPSKLRNGNVVLDEDEEPVQGLSHQTLGGQVMAHEPGKPTYMVGAFHGNELHLTALDGVVQMRPQFHHIDATIQNKCTDRRREREAIEPLRRAEPRAVQMVARSAADLEGGTSGPTIRELLQAAQDESWVRLEYKDEEAEEAYQAYHEKMFLQDTKDAPELVSSMTGEEYLDAISVPRLDHGGKARKKPPPKKPKVRIEIPDDTSSEHGGEQEA